MISTKVFTLTFTVVMAILLRKASSSGQRVRLTEGKPGDVPFQFDFEPDVDIQIRIGNRRPFYRFKRIHGAGLTKSQKERFSVEVENDELHHTIRVRLIISVVLREDEGPFLCDLLQNGEVLLKHTRRVGVSVDFPPGKASCRQENHHIDHSNTEWALMKCSAPVGSDQGIIECYQEGERRPPLERPIQNETTLTQKIWMKNAIPIYCCASAFDKPQGMCQCDDFLWDPVMQKRVKGDVNPCPEPENVMPSPGHAGSQSNSKATTTVHDAQATTERNSFDNHNNRSLDDLFPKAYYPEHCFFSAMNMMNIFVALILSLQVITVITLIAFIRKMKIIKAPSETTKEDEEQCILCESSPILLKDSDAVRKRKSFGKSRKSKTFPELKK